MRLKHQRGRDYSYLILRSAMQRQFSAVRPDPGARNQPGISLSNSVSASPPSPRWPGRLEMDFIGRLFWRPFGKRRILQTRWHRGLSEEHASIVSWSHSRADDGLKLCEIHQVRCELLTVSKLS